MAGHSDTIANRYPAFARGDVPAVPHELIANADTVVALGEYSGMCKATGKSFKAPFVHVWKFDGNRVISFRQHTDTVVVQRALQADPA